MMDSENSLRLRRTSTAPEPASPPIVTTSNLAPEPPVAANPRIVPRFDDLQPISRTHSFDHRPAVRQHHHHHHDDTAYMARHPDYRVMGLGRPLPSQEALRHLRHRDHARKVQTLADHPRLRPLGPAAPSQALDYTDPWLDRALLTSALDSHGTSSLAGRSRPTTLTDAPLQRHGGTQYIVVTPDQLEDILSKQPRFQMDHSRAGSRPISRHTSVREDNQGVKGQNDSEKDSGDGQVVKRTDMFDSSDEESSSVSSSDEAYYPNPWARFRGEYMREAFAEFLGTCILIIFGNGVNCQVILTGSKAVAETQSGSYLSISFGWGIGVAMGVYVAGGISGGHINPAVTISLATWRGFPWRKVPIYVISQILGAMSGALLVYITYVNAINRFEGGSERGVTTTGTLFFTGVQDYVTDVSAWFNEYLDTCILMMVIFAIGDRNNTPPPDGLNGIILLFLIVGIGACLGVQTAYGINPARDFGPRLGMWFVGYGRGVWNYRNQYWLWTEYCATISGGITGGLIYDLLIYTGPESPINSEWGWHHVPLVRRFVRDPKRVSRPTDPEAGTVKDRPQAETAMPAGEDPKDRADFVN